VANDFWKKSSSLPLTVQENLVQGLTAEHREFFDLYQEIHDAVTGRKYSVVAKHATKFHDRLHDHLAAENIKLYAELKRHLESADMQKRQVVHNLQREMFTIGRAAVEFIQKAETIALNDANAGQFRNDLEGVGTVLARRIRQEEDYLFPLFVEAMR
jgi:regulator of sigma D